MFKLPATLASLLENPSYVSGHNQDEDNVAANPGKVTAKASASKMRAFRTFTPIQGPKVPRFEHRATHLPTCF